MAALWKRAGHYIFVLWFLSSSYSFFFFLLFSCLISAVADWMSTILLHMVWPLCEFRMQVWNVLHAARWKCRTQKIAKNWPSGHNRTTLSGYIFATKVRIDDQKKSSNTSSTYSRNMVNFGPLAAEIVSLVWAPLKFQRVSRLGSVTARHSTIGRQPNFAALNRGRHLYSSGRPSRWALADISSWHLEFSTCSSGF